MEEIEETNGFVQLGEQFGACPTWVRSSWWALVVLLVAASIVATVAFYGQEQTVLGLRDDITTLQTEQAEVRMALCDVPPRHAPPTSGNFIYERDTSIGALARDAKQRIEVLEVEAYHVWEDQRKVWAELVDQERLARPRGPLVRAYYHQSLGERGKAQVAMHDFVEALARYGGQTNEPLSPELLDMAEEFATVQWTGSESDGQWLRLELKD